MATEAYREWYDSEDGPSNHDIYESDLERAFEAGRIRGIADLEARIHKLLESES